jgi:hypothetical protein
MSSRTITPERSLWGGNAGLANPDNPSSSVMDILEDYKTSFQPFENEAIISLK